MKVKGDKRAQNPALIGELRGKKCFRAWRADGSYRDFTHKVDWFTAVKGGLLPSPPGTKEPEPEKVEEGEKVVDVVDDAVTEEQTVTQQEVSPQEPEKGAKIRRK